jgi:hypothetical protein
LSVFPAEEGADRGGGGVREGAREEWRDDEGAGAEGLGEGWEGSLSCEDVVDDGEGGGREACREGSMTGWDGALPANRPPTRSCFDDGVPLAVAVEVTDEVDVRGLLD